MRKSKGFTLLELLVVIGIIAVLLAILMPALNKARELGQRTACANLLKAIGTANELYAGKFDGYYTPIALRTTSGGSGGDSDYSNYWWINPAFRSCMEIDSYEKDLKPGEDPKVQAPPAFQCPTDKIVKDPANAYLGGTLMSYGYNMTDFGGWFDAPRIPPAYRAKVKIDNKDTFVYGLRTDSIRRPAEKLAFIDGQDWWVNWFGGIGPSNADYTAGWDILRQAKIADYRGDKLSPAIFGPPMYRHNEGANVGFYDCHVSYMKKQEIFIKADYPARPGMWTALK